MKLDRRYAHLHLWHTFVRHSKKKAADGTVLPVQFMRRVHTDRVQRDRPYAGAGQHKQGPAGTGQTNRVQQVRVVLQDGSVVVRKAGTQKKDGY